MTSSPPSAVSHLLSHPLSSVMGCSLDLCTGSGQDWAHGASERTCLRREAKGRAVAYPTCLVGNLTPGYETFSICQIGFHF